MRSTLGSIEGADTASWRCDPAVYVILDPEHAGGHALDDLTAQASAGGASLFQLRVKQASTRDALDLARRCLAALATSGRPLLINDRVDIALASGAQGVHLGQDDLPPAEARRLLGPEAIIGLTVRSLEEARSAPLDLVDYLSIGGVFPTASKTGVARYLGLEGLKAVVATLPAPRGFPICAISGIKADNAGDVIAAGLDGVAVITAISEAAEPAAAARQLRSVVEAAQASRAAS